MIWCIILIAAGIWVIAGMGILEDSNWQTWILGGCFWIGVYIAYVWLLFRPASMGFYDKPIPIPNESKHRNEWITIPPNKDIKIFIGLCLRWPRTFKEIDVRFVKKNPLWPWLFLAQDDPVQSMKVLRVEDQYNSILNDQDYLLVTHVDNKAGGIAASYKDPIECPFRGWMWYVLTVRSAKSEDGYLSFQIRRGNKIQGVIRRKIYFR